MDWESNFESFYILRDYSKGMKIRFQTKYPEILEGKVDLIRKIERNRYQWMIIVIQSMK